MDISSGYPVPADEDDYEAIRLITKTQLAQVRLQALEERISELNRHFAYNFVAFVAASGCIPVFLGDEKAFIHAMLWVAFAFLGNGTWPYIRFGYRWARHGHYHMLQEQAIEKQRILLIKEQKL